MTTDALELLGSPAVAFAQMGDLTYIELDRIDPDPEQPRLDVDDELADSIRAQGVLQPIVVRVHADLDRFIIVDGERRYRGALKAKLETIPARVVYDADDDGDRLLRQVTFNEGKRLAPMEEAKAWKRIMDAKRWNIQQLATALGRAKSTVSDRLAMLNAPKPFQPLFESGALPAAAAPIVRKFADVPESILRSVVEELTEDYWRENVATGTPVTLAEVKGVFDGNVLWRAGLRRLDHLGAAAKGYTGPTCTVDGTKYATDAEQLDKVTQAYYRSGSTSHAPNSPAAERAEQQRREREAAERKKQQAKKARIRAVFQAVSAKLPTSIGANVKDAGGWTLLLVDLVLKEVHYDTCRVLAAELGLQGEKHTNGSAPYADMIKRHAKQLAAPERVQLVLQLLLAPDLNLPSYSTDGPRRIAAAAKLCKIDPKKVGAPDPAADKPTKKGGRR